MDKHFLDSEYFHRLSTLEKTGWWELDLTKNEMFFSEYICQLLGVTSKLRLNQFVELIDEGYREEINSFFFSSMTFSGVFEKIFPIKTFAGPAWVRLYYDSNAGQSGDKQKPFGSLKVLDGDLQNRERLFQRNLYNYMRTNAAEPLEMTLR